MKTRPLFDLRKAKARESAKEGKIMRRHSWWFVGLLVAVLLLGSIPAASANGAWWNTNWAYRRKLTLDNSGVDEVLTDFPILVCLDSSFDYSKIKADGSDLRFVDADDTTLLPHEIEKWNYGGNSWIWVKVPGIQTSGNPEHIWMYYGNPSPPAPPNPEDVWDSDFKMVQHLQETSGTHYDSTQNNNDSIAVTVTTQGSAAGQIDGADDLDGIDDDIEVADSNSLDIANQITLEAWISPTNASAWRTIMSKFETGPTRKDIYWYVYTNKLGIALAGPRDTDWTSNVAISEDVWAYVAATYNGSAIRLFKDGTNADTLTGLSGTLDLATNTKSLYLGSNTVWGEYHYGLLDEVRISSIARSAEWIEAQHKSMTCGFAAFGMEETPPPPPPLVPVGGIVVPVNKLGLLAPWLGLAALMVAAVSAVVVKRRAA